MLHKLEQIKDKYLAMEARMADPSVLSDPSAYSALMREYKKLTPIMEAYTAYQRAEQNVQDALELLDMGDPELKEMAQEELRDAKDDLRYSPDELEQIESRLDVIHKLRKKYGATCQDILLYLEHSCFGNF